MQKNNNWVWFRGLARHSAHWHHFEDHFRKKFPEAVIEKLDLRGNGKQAHSPSLLTIADNVRDLRARSELAAKGPIHLLTISFGSMVGLEWAERFPQELASITVINTSDGRNSHFFERMRPGNYASILRLLMQTKDPLGLEKNLMELIAPHTKGKEEVIAEFAKFPPTSAANLLRQLLAAATFRLADKPPTCPLLLLASRGDGFVNPVCSERIGKAWGHEVHWHPGAGHDIPLEDPEWVVEQLGSDII